MKKIPLSGGKHGYALIDDEDYKLVSSLSWQPDRHGKITYAKHIEYIKGGKGLKTKCILMHRLILGLKDHSTPHVDHRNGNGLDNTRANIRVATSSQNQQNLIRPQSNKTSVYKGVSLTQRGKPWRASICIDGKRLFIGSFDAEIDAAKAYDMQALKLFGDFAHVNFPMVRS